MLHRIKRKQPNSKMCLVCGLKNLFGLKAFFYELDNSELLGVFNSIKEHQGYPGRLHGGIITAMLDETIGRAIMIKYDKEIWGVTVEITTHFKVPIPLGKELRVIGRITKDTKRLFEGTGEILLPNGKVAAEGIGKYFKYPIEKIANFDAEEHEWKVRPSSNDPKEVEI
jgi:acyl-coenzyme A thioesterase PaaI-like protein